MSFRCEALGSALLFGISLVVLGCGEAEELGSLMLAVSTDMYIDKDVSRVDIVVQPEHGPTQSAQISLFPGLEGQFLPGTFSIIEGSKPGEFVRIRVIARQAERARVVREAALKVPRHRTALLSMPIQWLCDGQVRQEGQLTRSDCDDDYTCVAGTCQLAEIDETTLPDYQAEEVFGGGNATGGGECFDTLECFNGATVAPIDTASCRIATAGVDDLNVGVALPLGGDGHCTETQCWIPLDHSELTGWFEVNGQVQLPSGVCERVASGGAQVFVSHACASKSPDTPTCGPWSLVGTEPGGVDPNVIGPEGPPPALAVDNRRLAVELTSATQRLAGEMLTACSNLAALSPPAQAGVDELQSACALALTAVAPAAPLTWYHIPTRCWPDAELRLSCESECDAECPSTEVAARCMVGLSGTCSGTCDSKICLGAEAAEVDCSGGCAGTCAGNCEGTCLGQCAGTCDLPSPDGYCDGRCTGVCDGLCQGRCQGTCAGRCDLDPALSATACLGGACLGACSGPSSDVICDGPLTPSPCQLQLGCEGNCQVLSQFNVECASPTVWLMPRSGRDAALSAALRTHLPAIVSLRDRKTSMVLDEASRLLERMNADPQSSAEDIAQVETDIALLQATLANASNITSTLGAERAFPGPAVGPVSCEKIRATGTAPLIDDFEDGNALVLLNDGRDGGWHSNHDSTGVLVTSTEPPVPEAGGANGSSQALHLAGSGFTEWGAGFSLDLRQNSAPYDAILHTGVRFWAKGTNRLRIVFMQANLAVGHPCATCNTQNDDCSIFYSAEVILTGVWSAYDIDWTVLGRGYQGGAGFAPDQLLNIQFEAPAGAPFDFWLDDVGFR